MAEPVEGTPGASARGDYQLQLVDVEECGFLDDHDPPPNHPAQSSGALWARASSIKSGRPELGVAGAVPEDDVLSDGQLWGLQEIEEDSAAEESPPQVEDLPPNHRSRNLSGSTSSIFTLQRLHTWSGDAECSDQPSLDTNGVEIEPAEKRKPDFVVSLDTPYWVDALISATGIPDFSCRIERERERRENSLFEHPFPQLRELAGSLSFEIVVSAIVATNCLLLGWEVSREEGMSTFDSIAEHVFLAIYAIEWAMRVLAFGWVWIFEVMSMIDTFLIFFTGILLKWGMEPMGVDIAPYRMYCVLRVLRLVRLARSLRTFAFFKELWTLIHGLIHCTRPLLWTLAIGLMILYVFAVIATEFIARRAIFEEDDHAQEFFGNVLRSMLSMFQIMTLDSYGENIVRPIMLLDSRLGFFFVGFIMVGVFVFWNLITATIVEEARKTAMKDTKHQAGKADAEKVKEFKVLTDLFIEIDMDGSGELSLCEFISAMGTNPKVREMVELLELDASDVEDVWTNLDDGDGLLNIREFATGIRRMKGQAKAKDILDTIRKMRQTILNESKLRAQVYQLGMVLESTEAEIAGLARDTGEIVGLFEEVYHRLQTQVDAEDRKRKLEQARTDRAAKLQFEEEAARELEEEEADEEGLPIQDEAAVVEELKMAFAAKQKLWRGIDSWEDVEV